MSSKIIDAITAMIEYTTCYGEDVSAIHLDPGTLRELGVAVDDRFRIGIDHEGKRLPHALEGGEFLFHGIPVFKTSINLNDGENIYGTVIVVEEA